jgi:hypothetical protein
MSLMMVSTELTVADSGLLPARWLLSASSIHA